MVILFDKVLFLALTSYINVVLSVDKEDLLNWCLDSQNHKSKPGKEDELHGECLPWKDHACCTHEVTLSLHKENMYNFTLDPCLEHKNVPMSHECRQFFLKNNCFYECEPNIGLWVVKTNRKIASERFHKVPLCASICDKWFKACEKDYTCAHNWPKDFKFFKGRNTCKTDSKCSPFKKVYKNAKDFCESVWDHSWVYTPDDKPCMKLWFEDSSNNPNRKVAEYYIELNAANQLSVNFVAFSIFALFLHKMNLMH